jgi:phytoene desaturase
MNVIEQEGFRIDMGPTMLMMPEVLEALFTSCGRRLEEYVTLKRLVPAYRIYWPDGDTMYIGNSIQALSSEAAKRSPEDAEAILALMDGMRRKYENARYNFIERPFNQLGDLLNAQTLTGLMRAMPIESVYRFVSRFIKNDRLRQALTFQTLYLGISPHECPSIYALLPYIELEFGVWYPTGGMSRVAEGIATLLRELGGRIHYRRRVDSIIVENRRAVGLRTADDCEWRADAVISNLDLPTAYSRLLPQTQRRKHTDERLAQRRYGCSGYLLYLGVRGLHSHWGQNSVILSEDYNGVLNEVCHLQQVPSDPALHVCIPTRTDASLAPEGHDVVYVLAPCPNAQAPIDWQAEGPRFRERILDKLEAMGMPGLRDKIVFERTFTPPEFESLYGCYGGAAYGGLIPTFGQSAYFRPHSRSEEVAGLYFVGASTHPGGGIPIVLTSGRLVAADVIASACG